MLSDCNEHSLQCVCLYLTGHNVIFSLETASDYVKEERASTYGFRVMVVGYEWPPSPPDSLRHLEKELSYLGGLCAASLIKKDLCLPPSAGKTILVIEYSVAAVYYTIINTCTIA